MSPVRFTFCGSVAIYTLSQKELEKALHKDGDLSHARKLKARIEFVCEEEDIKKVSELLKQLKKHEVKR